MRKSAFRGTWSPNQRPYISIAPDAYVAIQGETTAIACGTCRREVNFNDYITGISTEASVDSPPGSANINLSIPDNDVNDFFVDGELLIIDMMEIEIFSKGYYLIGGMPQYYRIFWGLISSVTKNWSNGVTSISISCKDMLRWWELTSQTKNPAFLEGFGSSAGGYTMFQNQFAGSNPYTTIIQLAKDAMGDFMLTTGSFTSYRPEKGPESRVIGSFSKDIMAYWQLKFANIQSNLVLYGTSGQAYTFSAVQGTVSPLQLTEQIYKQEYELLKRNGASSLLFSNQKEIATAKIEVSRAGDVEFFQADNQSKLTIALEARDQIQYEFYCDTTGDIVFKPPFYNLNVLPNKPVSWIQDIDIIDDSIVNSEAEVVTHVTSSGNAFGGVTDWGLNDDITTPRTGVYDYHLLRRYGWRHADLQVEWAGNPRKLFFHLLDWMDRTNAKRRSGTVTIPIRPELRMGFPVWIPRYDSFFYIQGISHQYSPGGQATTTLTLTARRSKFIAPKNIGEIKRVASSSNTKKTSKSVDSSYEVNFPGSVGSTSGLSQDSSDAGKPAIVRDPKTGKILGYPNVVMVYRTTYDGTVLAKILENKGSSASKNPGKKSAQEGNANTYNATIRDIRNEMTQGNRDKIISRIRAHRYEAGMTNAGAYDYAHDVDKSFKELALVPANRITWGSGTDGGPDVAKNISDSGKVVSEIPNASTSDFDSQMQSATEAVKSAKTAYESSKKSLKTAEKNFISAKKSLGTDLFSNESSVDSVSSSYSVLFATVETSRQDVETKLKALDTAQKSLQLLKNVQKQTKTKTLPSLNIMIRPVSDEFGFEVVGHYRYGRGAFIDRGKLKIKDVDTNQVSNQLNIQFSPTAGIITDANSVTNVNSSMSDYASKFESMQPDDYATGAVFSGTNGQISDVQTTSSATYTNAINANKGTSLYIEADATRRAKTLAELSPIIKIDGFSSAFNKCSCGLSRTCWYNLLPQEFITKIIGSGDGSVGLVNSVAEQASLGTSTNIYDDVLQRDNKSVNQFITGGGIEGTNFFSSLSEYLTGVFNETYQQHNAVRENAYTAVDRQVINPNSVPVDNEQDNILSEPNNPLFDRASQGDTTAIAALQNEANFNFGLTSNMIQNWDSNLERAKKSNVRPSAVVPQPLTPTIDNSIINPTKFNSAAGDQFIYRGSSDGGTVRRSR